MKKAVISIIILYFIQGIIHNLGHPVTPAFVRSLEIPDYMFGFFYATMSFGLMVSLVIVVLIHFSYLKKEKLGK